jgi:hypothetical protein
MDKEIGKEIIEDHLFKLKSQTYFRSLLSKIQTIRLMGKYSKS